MIKAYFNNINEVISSFASIIKRFTKTEKTYSIQKGYIKGEIVFNDDSTLSFMELKDISEKQKIKYRYHFMNNENSLIFRYDNAEHYHEISTFPHHKHLTNNIVESLEPELIDIMIEIYKTRYK